jgi:hypothetical protein
MSSRKRKGHDDVTVVGCGNVKALDESQKTESLFISWHEYCDQGLELPLGQLILCDLVRECRPTEVQQLADHMKEGLCQVTFDENWWEGIELKIGHGADHCSTL